MLKCADYSDHFIDEIVRFHSPNTFGVEYPIWKVVIIITSEALNRELEILPIGGTSW